MIRRTVTAAVVAGGLLLGACGGETVYVTVEPTTTTTARTTTTAPPETRPPASFDSPSYNSGYDPNAYDAAIWSEAHDFWWAFSTEELLSMGLIICEEFDRGQTLNQVTEDLVGILIRTGTADLMEGTAAMVVSALTFLCPEHQWWLNTL